MLPGRTGRDPELGCFPLPMRVSGGRPVTDLIGKNADPEFAFAFHIAR